MKLRIHRLAVAEIDHEVDYYESVTKVMLGTPIQGLAGYYGAWRHCTGVS